MSIVDLVTIYKEDVPEDFRNSVKYEDFMESFEKEDSTSTCCHKRYADTLNWSISDVISYRRPKFRKPFRIDTPVEGSYYQSRVN